MGKAVSECDLYEVIGGYGIDLLLPSGSKARLICGDKAMLIRVSNDLYNYKERRLQMEKSVGDGLVFKEHMEKHGKYALKMHVYRTGEEKEVSEKLPFMKEIEGRLVMVKCNTENTVQLFDMENMETFEVSMDDYKAHCNNLWMLDEALMIRNPEEFERQSAMVRQAYEACGYEFEN